jgi:hypothetical protein
VLKRNPVVLVGGLIYAVVILPQSALSALGIPIIPSLLQIVTFFITPFIVAGILGMTYEGRVRETSLDTFKKIGKKKYVSLLAGNLVIFAITFVFILLMLLLAFFVVGIGFAAASAESALAGGVGILSIAVFLVAILVFLLVMFFLQFWGPAIVADNVGVGAGFKRSAGVVKRNILSTLGFGVLNLVINLALALPALTLALLPVLTGAGTEAIGATGDVQSASQLGSSLLTQVGLIVYSFVIAIVMTPFRLAFAVSFYDNHRPSAWE